MHDIAQHSLIVTVLERELLDCRADILGLVDSIELGELIPHSLHALWLCHQIGKRILSDKLLGVCRCDHQVQYFINNIFDIKDVLAFKHQRYEIAIISDLTLNFTANALLDIVPHLLANQGAVFVADTVSLTEGVALAC